MINSDPRVVLGRLAAWQPLIIRHVVIVRSLVRLCPLRLPPTTNAVHSPSRPQLPHPTHQSKPGSKSASASADYSDESEEEEEEEDDSDGDEEDGGQSLSDMLGANNAASAAASAASSSAASSSSSSASSDALPSHQKLLDFVSGLTSTSRDGRRGAAGDGRSGGGGATRAAEETEAGTESEVRLLDTQFAHYTSS